MLMCVCERERRERERGGLFGVIIRFVWDANIRFVASDSVVLPHLDDACEEDFDRDAPVHTCD